MTREEAKTFLLQLNTDKRLNPSEHEAIRVAISALEQEPCEDAISREAAKNEIKCWIGSGEYRYTNATDYLSKRIRELPSVTQKSGKWMDKDLRKEEYVLIGKCSVCGQVRVKDKFCSNCGAKMVEPQESEE